VTGRSPLCGQKLPPRRREDPTVDHNRGMVDTRGDAWSELSRLIATSPLNVMVCPPHDASATAATLGLGTGSFLGAFARNTSGVIVDDGWLRLLGGSSSADGLPGLDQASAATTGLLVIAIDVLGGVFALDGGALGTGNGSVHHFSVDSLSWEDLELGHAAFVTRMLAGATTSFYESLRWPGWQADIATLQPRQGLSLYPYPFTAEGKDVSSASKRAVPMAELLAVHNDIATQFGTDRRVQATWP